MEVIAFVNRGSGGNKGNKVHDILTRLLGPENVFDLKADKGPERGLSVKCSNPDVEIRAMACGGDGTFSWVANAIEKQSLSHVKVVPLPLGSGNDMSRALGWGIKYPGEHRIANYIKALRVARYRTLDVWRLTANHSLPVAAASSIDADGVEHGARPLMCNYLSLGVDAHVELTFNQRRWEKPHRYKSRIGNFKEHLLIGVRHMFSEATFRIHEHIESLHVDGNRVELARSIQALIFLNIPSYGGGTQPWGFPRKKHPVEHMYVDDQRVEVIGLKSLNHYARFRLGSHGVRLAQGSQIRVKLKTGELPFQVDGEPWIQRGGEIELAPGNPVNVCEGFAFKSTSRRMAKFNKEYGDKALIPVEVPDSACVT